jgi:hypothetical protein
MGAIDLEGMDVGTVAPQRSPPAGSDLLHFADSSRST